MKHIKRSWKWLVPMVILALVGGFLTMNAGEVTAANTSADNNFKTRYSTDVTISNLEEMVGSGTTGTSGQIKIHDGTDYEPKTVTASGLASGTVSSTGALSLTGTLADTKAWVGNSGGSAVAVNLTIINDITATMTNAGIMNATLGSAVVNSPKLDKYTLSLLVNAGATTNSVTGDASDLYTGHLLTTIGGINGTNLVNDVYSDGLGNFVISMVNAVSDDAAWTLGFINSN